LPRGLPTVGGTHRYGDSTAGSTTLGVLGNAFILMRNTVYLSGNGITQAPIVLLV
jgi:hypothetical protein